MGILNVTEDSFSDGGLYLEPAAALRHACQMIAEGAQIIDIGGESTRPGAVRVPAEVEQRRVVSAIRAIRTFGTEESAFSGSVFDDDAESNIACSPDFASRVRGITISVDTTRASVAAASLDAGADIINDVSGGTLDSAMAPLVAERGCKYIVQHWRGWLTGAGESAASQYADTAAESVAIVYSELMREVDAVTAAGVAPERIIIDPGLGFAKPDPELNCALIEAVPRFAAGGYPVLIGASRKRFVRKILENRCVAGTISQTDLDAASAALAAQAALRGAAAVRVHEVRATAAALAVADSLRNNNERTDVAESAV